LAALVFLLQQPTIAKLVIDFVNGVLDFLWALIPNSLLPTVDNLFEDVFAVSTNGDPLQFDPGSGATWLLVLALFLGLAVLVSRSSLPSYRGLRVSPLGSFLGGLVGGLNGFVIISLVREYLKESNLPNSTFSSEIASSSSGGIASSGIGFRAVDVPNVTILDSFLPWIVIIAGILIFLVALNSRLALRSDKGFRKIEVKVPMGYRIE
jgi:uncharacterized membrane protein YkvI